MQPKIQPCLSRYQPAIDLASLNDVISVWVPPGWFSLCKFCGPYGAIASKPVVWVPVP
ncbi:MAG: hypothetical protein WBE83_01765 [Candidatus Cybelea sp.]